MAILSKAGITSGSLIEASHVTQIIDALTSSGSIIDILVTGSFRVAGTTQLGILGTSSQSPLLFNPDISGQSVFYFKNPNGTFTIGTGANPYGGSDLVTLSPLGALGLNGNLTTTNAYITSNLGVGIANPLTRFAVSNNGSQSIEMDYSAPLNANYIQSFDRVTNKNVDLIYYMAVGATGSHKFYTNGVQKMVIDPNGFVGIGTATPTVALEVVGATILNGNTIISGSNLIISSSYPRLFLTDTNSDSDFSIINDNGNFLIFDDTNSRYNFFVSSSGNIGINKYGPNAQLDVNGNVLVTGSITATTTNTSVLNVTSIPYGVRVSGSSEFTGSLTVNGNSTFNGSVGSIEATSLKSTNGASLTGSINISGSVSTSGSLGYGGVNGSVTQLTSRTTPVTINKICGSITLVTAAGSTSPSVFTVNNSQVGLNDVIVIHPRFSSFTSNVYKVRINEVYDGGFKVGFETTGGTNVDTVIFNFFVLKIN